PQGVTIRYVQHQPLGRLMASIVSVPEEEATQLWQPIAIGRESTIKSERGGLLMLKLNDAAGDLWDNQGNLRVAIGFAKP
ncbi:MAG: hypothetical protein KGQ51_16780, partial [Planctomycetes bacterium]|nr:hypothetical protein [Planctomycetota bacterium]